MKRLVQAHRLHHAVHTRDGAVSVKTPDVETARMLIDAAAAERAPYFPASWVRVRWDRTPTADLHHRIATSYRIVLGGLSKKQQAILTNSAT